MKTAIITLLSLLLGILSVNAQDAASAYPKAMQGALAQMQKAQSADEHTAAINSFSRIGEAMPNEWLPAYYKNFTRLNMLDKLPTAAAKDKMLEEVLADVDKLLKQYPNNSELLTLKGYHHLLFVGADPANRGPQFSGLTMQLLQQAIAANPNNPRAYLLMGQMQLGIAQFMNSPIDGACKSVGRANELYEASAKEADSLHPTWGMHWAKQLQQQCGTQK